MRNCYKLVSVDLHDPLFAVPFWLPMGWVGGGSVGFVGWGGGAVGGSGLGGDFRWEVGVGVGHRGCTMYLMHLLLTLKLIKGSCC